MLTMLSGRLQSRVIQLLEFLDISINISKELPPELLSFLKKKKRSSNLLLVRYVSDSWNSYNEGKILAPHYSELRFLQRNSFLLCTVPALSKHRDFLISISSEMMVIWLC